MKKYNKIIEKYFQTLALLEPVFIAFIIYHHYRFSGGQKHTHT